MSLCDTNFMAADNTTVDTSIGGLMSRLPQYVKIVVLVLVQILCVFVLRHFILH